MNLRLILCAALAVSAGLACRAEAAVKLEQVDKLPDGLPRQIAAVLDQNGYRIVGADGPLMELWLVQGIEVIPDFKPGLSLKYPFTAGSLIGAVRVPQGVTQTDFRAQEFTAGLYTLRYAKLPEDGNHIGAAPTSDFLLAVPVSADADPKPIASADKLAELSVNAVEGTHPAILHLMPSEQPPKKAALSHDQNHDFHILNVTAAGKAKGKDVPIGLRLVVVGHSPE